MVKMHEITNSNPFYRGTDFWMLNGSLSEEEIVRQLTAMHGQGVYSFIARTYIGLESDYPGKDFKANLKIIIETAKKLGMKLFLQAGYMPEHIPDLKEEHTLKCIEVSKEYDGDILCEYDGYYFRKTNCASFLDMFSSDTVIHYLKVCYEDIWEEFSDEFGKTIMSIWVDEPSYSEHFLPYPEGIEEKFFERWGYSLRENVAKLYFDGENYESVRYHYRKLLQDLLEESYFKNLHLWCREHSLMASGHLMEEDTLRQQIRRAGASMPYYPYFDMPGIDILCAEMNHRDNPILPIKGENYSYPPQYITTPIQCASVSRQLGTEHTLCEMYGVVSQDMNFKNQKYVFDFVAAHGINHRSVHGFFYSLAGRRKRAYPPHVNYYQPYFEDYKKISDYVANVSEFISSGKAVRDVLILHPLPSAFCEYTLFDTPSSKALTKRDNSLLKLLTNLTLSGAEFDFGDERIIEQYGSVEKDTFKIGKASYKTVILPCLKTISKSTHEKLLEFIKYGGKVLILGDAPYMTDGTVQKEKLFKEAVARCDINNLSEILSFIGKRDFEIISEDIPSLITHRKTDGDKNYFFIFNTDCGKEKKIILRIKDNVKAFSINGFSGKMCEIPVNKTEKYTDIPLIISEGQSILLKTEKGESKAKNVFKTKSVIYSFDDKWKIKRESENVLLLDFCTFKKNNGEYSEEVPVIAVDIILKKENFSGTLSQKFTFESDIEIPLSLALEKANDHTVIFNGEEVPVNITDYYMTRDFDKIPLPVCKKGRNELILKREYSPLETPKSIIGSLFQTLKGCETENVYILGNFKISAAPEAERCGNIRLCKNMHLAAEDFTSLGELTLSGYPFYAGSISLTSDFTISETKNIFLCADVFTGCIASVYINGILCGDIITPPYSLDISNAVKKGKNKVEIIMKNTLRNLLGPYHRAQGEHGNLFGSGYGGLGGAWRGDLSGDDKWYYRRDCDSKVWTDSYMCTGFAIKNVKIIKECEK